MPPRTKMEDLHHDGIQALDENDWTVEAQKRVILGSDGLWLRFGVQPDEGWKSLFFSFRFNPCVSLFALIMLFGLVGFCSVPPGDYCSKRVTHFVWNHNGTHYDATNIASISVLPDKVTTKITGAGDRLAVEQSEDGASIRPYRFDNSAEAWVSEDSWWVPMTSETRLEAKSCFMPQLEFGDWMKWVTDNFTWLYILTQDVWIVFVFYIAFSKYGSIKLGKDDDEPEFTYFQWFAMLFTAGIATGLFFFAATEPQYYYNSAKIFNGADKAVSNKGYYERNRFAYNGVFEDPSTGKEVAVFSTPNERAQNAMTLTWYHWGLHGWVCYSVVGLLLALLHFRKGLPMTIKTCFYPLLGTRIYGFAGDFVDTISVVATTMGVCTSLGMGMMQLNYGIEYLNGGQHWMGLSYYNEHNYNEWSDRVTTLKTFWDSWPETLQGSWYTESGAVNIATAAKVATMEAQNNQQALLIWIVTAVATCSVLAGLKNGIARLAVMCLIMGQFLLFYIWMMDDTHFFNNFFVQTLGDYIQKLPGLGFYASAVEQSDANNAYGEYASWQYWWTIFYWGWWIAWAPMVGVFLARLGRGRTVREFIVATMISAVLYNFIFMLIIGGAGLKMQLLAEKFGVGTETCAWSGELVREAGGDMYRTHPFKQNICRKTSTGKYSTEGELFCSTVTNLACSLKVDGSAPLFDIVGQYGETGAFMVTLTLVCLTFYFICSSDSGSLVDDMICANGLPEPSLIQRFVWAMTEGAAATALLSVGKYVGTVDGGLKALRACSIAVGLPYTFLICFICLALWRALQYEAGDLKWGCGFKTEICDIGVTLYQCGEGTSLVQNLRPGKVDIERIKKNAIAFVCPVIPMMSTAAKLNSKKGGGNAELTSSRVKLGGAGLFFYLWFILICVDWAPVKDGPQEWGSIKGNANSTSGNYKYYVSNRYGYYHEWTNEGGDRNPGSVIKHSHDVDTRAGEVGEMDVGQPAAKSRRIATFGWFMFFCLFCLHTVEIRADVRKMYGIPGTMLEDWLSAWWWPMCLTQIDEMLDEELPLKNEKREVSM